MNLLRQIFGTSTPNTDSHAEPETAVKADTLLRSDATIEEVVEEISAPTSRPPRQSQPLTVGYASHVGAVRQRNEDSTLVISSLATGDVALPPFALLIVADGMGGHSEGQRASHFAARVVARDIMRHIYPPFLQIDMSEPGKPVRTILADAVQNANWAVNASNPESGTTLTATLIVGSRLYIAHVGDSRAYQFVDGVPSAEVLTVDHTFVQRLQDAGQITADEAAQHPQRNVLYRAVGQGERLEADVSTRTLSGSGWLLLCSDGLWGVLPSELIHATVTSATSPQHACDELITAALDAGGPDNITVVIARYETNHVRDI